MRIWTLLKLAIGAVVAFIGGLILPPEWLSRWGEVDEGGTARKTPIRRIARSKSRRRAT
jgi:hypothetical protein